MGQTITTVQAQTELAFRAIPKAERTKRSSWTDASLLSTKDLKAIVAKSEPKAKKAKAVRKAKHIIVDEATPKARRKAERTGTSELSQLRDQQIRAAKAFRKAMGTNNTAQAMAAYSRLMKGAK